MDELFLNKSFENATVFEFGYIAEPQQFEVSHIRFHIAPLTGGGEFEAATFTERGKRKEKTVAVNQLVVIQGWEHPKLGANTTHTPAGKAKFPAFSNKWDELLEQHLTSFGPSFQLIVDGRKRPQLKRSPEHGPLNLGDNSPTMRVTFNAIEIGSKWDREQLAKLWGYNCRQGLDHGVVRPANDNKIILFITHEKQSHSKQFNDKLEGDTVQMDGQPKHGSDDRLIHAAEHSDEIHLFYRDRPLEPFTYRGQVDLQSHERNTDQPSKFVFRLRGTSFVADTDSALVEDIKKIMLTKAGDPTTTLALISARVGQGQFGLAVRQFWEHRCSVTGSSTKAALEASHIQRWADSTDAQRLDPDNGLLLTANLHKLFDAGLISFDDSGKMLVSLKLSASEQEILGLVGKKLSKKPSAKTADYLSRHRAKNDFASDGL